MDERKQEQAPIEYESPTSRMWLNPILLVVLAGAPVVGVLDQTVPWVHRLLGMHEEIHLLYEGGAFALGTLAIVIRAIKRRFSQRPVERMPDWL